MHSSRTHHHHAFAFSSLASNTAILVLLAALFLVLLLLFLIITAQPAYAQDRVPPTARQAATMPQFGSRLAPHPAQRDAVRPNPSARPAASFKYPVALRGRGSRGWLPNDNVIYDNGAINGTTDAWTINFGFAVSDSFTVQGSSASMTGLNFGAWLFPGDALQTAEVLIGSTAFGNDISDQVVNFTQSGCTSNQYGFNVCTASGSLTSSVNLNSGTYWVTLQNASVNTGDPIYWDENSGPSMASENSVGTIPSEAFSILGTDTSCQFPPCAECVHDKPQNGFKIIHNFGSGEDPDAGLAIDHAGNLYGATHDAGSNGQGLAFKLAQVAQGWIFTPLYNFLGGDAGQNPGSEVLGPEGALYGPANGGLQQCGSSGDQYCGVIYRLRPSPFACLTALCSWGEQVIYRFTGMPDGSGPNGNLLFDGAGNLYGTTFSGGAFGLGTVFELTPSNGGWTEKVLYSFTGQNGDGSQPVSLVLGQDGNLYGTTYRNAFQGGVYFQLVPSGEGWVEQIIFSYGPCNQDIVCTTPLLLLEHSGRLYGTYSYSQQTCRPDCHPDTYGRIFALTQGGSGWQFTTLYDTFGDGGLDGAGYDILYGLGIDSAGNLYATEGGSLIFQLISFGAVLKLPQPQQPQFLVSFLGDDFSDVEIGPDGSVYGITGRCNGTPGTVWQLTPP